MAKKVIINNSNSNKESKDNKVKPDGKILSNENEQKVKQKKSDKENAKKVSRKTSKSTKQAKESKNIEVADSNSLTKRELLRKEFDEIVEVIDTQSLPLPKKKELLIKGVELLGTLKVAAERLGYNLWTVYDWYKRDLDFRAKIDEAREKYVDIMIELAEEGLYQLIEKKDRTAIFFILNSKGRRHGWQPQQDINITGALDLSVRPVSFVQQKPNETSTNSNIKQLPDGK